MSVKLIVTLPLILTITKGNITFVLREVNSCILCIEIKSSFKVKITKTT